jgi:hypothetical protein
MKVTGPVSLSIRGRSFSKTELNIIKKCVVRHYKKGRTHISRKICEELNWKQPNGWLKDRACRDVLLKLHKIKLIKLPKSKIKRRSKSNDKPAPIVPLNYSIDKMPEVIDLIFAKGNGEELLWNNLVNQYHYLGHKVIVGRCIKYLIYGDNKLIGAISFSSPANRLAVRDQLLATCLGFSLNETKTYVINNTRFLILPNVKVKNLASQILAKATKQIVKDWLNYYLVKPTIVETFVQISRFEGTCYKASNWKCIGATRGFSKKGNEYVENNEPKKIFIYGLNKTARKQLSI